MVDTNRGSKVIDGRGCRPCLTFLPERSEHVSSIDLLFDYLGYSSLKHESILI